MSSTSCCSDSESDGCESHHHTTCVPVTCYYPTITHPLVYFSEVQRKAKKKYSNSNPQRRSSKVKSQNNKTCFRRAFEWYTKGRTPKSKNMESYKSDSRKSETKRGQCICEAHDFEKFAEWLDGKYEEYLNEQRFNKYQEKESQGNEEINQPKSCGVCNVQREKCVSYIMEPNPLVRAASDSCTRGKSTASELTTEPSRKNMWKTQSASSVVPTGPPYVPIDECGPENCPYRNRYHHPTPAETKCNMSESNKKLTISEPNNNVIDCKSIGINCCECEFETEGVEVHDGKSSCVCPTCCNVDSCVVNNLGTLIRTEKPYTVFVNDRSQTSDHSIKLDKDATGCYPFYMRIVCPDKLEPPCVCDYCP